MKKKVGSIKTSAVASSRSMPLISESPLGFEVAGDDDLSIVKPVDKQKKSSTKKETRSSVDIRQSPLGFELVEEGSDVKDTKKTADNTSHSTIFINYAKEMLAPFKEIDKKVIQLSCFRDKMNRLHK